MRRSPARRRAADSQWPQALRASPVPCRSASFRIGAAANRRLAPLGRKIGPDPASIDAAMIGGIAANNASGMCCGTAQNSYHTLAGMRVVLADGTVLDTSDATSRADFARLRPELV